MSQNEIAAKNAQILRNCSDSEKLKFLRNSINGYNTIGLNEDENLKNAIYDYRTYGILTLLTRGQFQNFLLDREISLSAKDWLLRIEESHQKGTSPFKEMDIEKIAKLYTDEDYGSILCDYERLIDKELDEASRLEEAYLRATQVLHLEDKVQVDGEDIESYAGILDNIKDYELRNLYAILLEPNLAQRNKWLQEITELEDMDELNTWNPTTMEENSRRYLYFMLKEATTRKFYRSIGIDYDDNGPNEMLPENVDFGIELEEIGVHHGECEVHGFESTYDITLRDYDRTSGKMLDTDTGEYQTDVLSTSYPKDYKRLDEQIDILNYYGARTNESCGCHIHVSTKYTPEYMIDEEETEDGEIITDTLYRAKHLQREIYEMQRVIGRHFNLFKDRQIDTCSYLATPDYDDLQLDKYQFVNMSSLDYGNGIEFRFLNLPFALDKKVIDAYADFVTSYMLYIDEGNNTTEYVKEAMEEAGVEKLRAHDEEELKFEVLKQQLCLKDSTMKVLDHIDEIYEFHNAGRVYTQDGQCIDYYSQYNSPILDENEEGEAEVLE